MSEKESRTESAPMTSADLIGQILHPQGTDANAARGEQECFSIDQIVHPLGSAGSEQEAVETQDPYEGPERRAPQVIIAEVVDDTPAEPRYPPLSR
jgi:hypothetical protein